MNITKAKSKKTKLKQDSVVSDTFHVGIELELIGENDDSEHDDDACSNSREESHREYVEGMSARELISNALGVSISANDASNLEPYLDRRAIENSEVESYMECSSCEDDDCGHRSGGDGENIRNELEQELKELTGNESFKVVSDSSIEAGSDKVGAEVCWNYFASKETIADNGKILDFLKDKGLRFNKSCGLHINLNNYLKVPQLEIATEHLSFLFNFVAASRRNSVYCNRKAMSGREKYSMLYNQGDRIEFRLFSPTMETVKLHHYVVLANTVYKRLAGKKAKLPKKSQEFFLDKLQKINGLDYATALQSIAMVNSLKDAATLQHLATRMPQGDIESDEMNGVA